MDKKIKGFMITIVLLCVLAIGLFTYTNFFSDREVIEYATIFVANKDIIAYTEIDAGLFTTKQMPKDAVVDGMITDLEDVKGTYAKGAIYKGDILTQATVTKNNDEAGLIYTMNFQPTYSGDIAFGDIVDVYNIAPDGKISIMYKGKKIQRAKTTQAAVVEDGSYEQAATLYFKVTQEEMLEYYTKLDDYRFIVLPLNIAYSSVEEAVANGNSTELNVDTVKYTTEKIDREGLTAQAFADMKGVDVEAFLELNPQVGNKNDLLTVNSEVKVPTTNDEPIVIE